MKYTAILRKLSCLVLALAVLMGVAGPGLAASYDVGNAEQMHQSWEAASNNSSASNTFNMTANIDMGGMALAADDNKTYVIQSKGSGDYDISNVTIVQGDEAKNGIDPRVVIKADVTDNGKKDSNAALAVYGDISTVVTGDVTVKVEGGEQTQAVIAGDGAYVTVSGDVNSKDEGVLVDDALLVVSGDVNVTGTRVDNTHPGIAVLASNDGTVDIGGDVISSKQGVTAYADGEIKIDGNLTAKQGNLQIREGGSLSVGGNVTQNGEVQVFDDAAVTIRGNLDAEGSLMVQDSSELTVNGHVDSVGQSNIINGSVVTVRKGLTITEDPTLPENTPSGVFVVKNSELHIYGATEVPEIYVMNNSDFCADGVESDLIVVGANGEKDKSEFYATMNVTGIDGGTTAIYTSGDSYTQLQNNVKGSLTAAQSAEVHIWGYLDHIPTVYDDAVVYTNERTKTNTFVDNSGTQAENNIVKLCKGYTTNSAMKSHLNCLEDIMIKASVDLTEKMGLGTAAVISLFQGDDIAVALLPDFDYDALLASGYHSGSLSNLKNAESVNSYEIEMYKAAIAQSLKAVEESPYSSIYNEADADMLKFSKAFYSLIDNKASDLPKDQVEFLKNALSNKIFSEEEAREFLIKFKGYKAGQNGIGSATKELVTLYKMADQMNKLNKAGKIVMTAEKFRDFFAQTYSNQVKVLDNMLMNQEMTPEMFIAVAELRSEYDDKVLGALGIARDVAEDYLVDKLKDCISKKIPLYGMVDAVMDIAEVLGATKKADAVHKAAPVICYLPQAMDAYEAAIQRVKNGDTSNEALELVHMNYIFVRESLKSLCNYMTIAGDAQEKTEYAELAKQLDSLEIGHAVGEVETIMMSGEFDLFYKNSIDPNVQYRYA